MNRTRLTFTVLLFLGTAASLPAGMVTRQNAAVVSELNNPDGWGFNLVQNCGGSGPAANCNNTPFTIPNFTGTGSASASAEWGSLHAFASAVGAGHDPIDRGGEASASASFVDYLTAMPCSNCNIAVSALITGELDGSVVSSGAGSAHGTLTLGAGIQGQSGGNICEATMSSTQGGQPSSGQRFCSASIAFTFGQTIELSASLGVGVEILSGGQGGSGIADFSHTAFISGVQLLDASGNVIEGVQFQSASGAIYPVAGESAPEPGSALLLLGGGLLLVPRLLKRKQP